MPRPVYEVSERLETGTMKTFVLRSKDLPRTAAPLRHKQQLARAADPRMLIRVQSFGQLPSAPSVTTPKPLHGRALQLASASSGLASSSKTLEDESPRLGSSRGLSRSFSSSASHASGGRFWSAPSSPGFGLDEPCAGTEEEIRRLTEIRNAPEHEDFVEVALRLAEVRALEAAKRRGLGSKAPKSLSSSWSRMDAPTIMALRAKQHEQAMQALFAKRDRAVTEEEEACRPRLYSYREMDAIEAQVMKANREKDPVILLKEEHSIRRRLVLRPRSITYH